MPGGGFVLLAESWGGGIREGGFTLEFGFVGFALKLITLELCLVGFVLVSVSFAINSVRLILC